MMGRLWATAGLVVGAAVAVSSQAPQFRSRVEAVRVDVSVMRGTTPVSGLTAANFGLTDAGVPQSITGVSVDTVPLKITLVLDTSGSLAGERMADLIAATRGLVEVLKPEDSVAVLAFSEAAQLAVSATRDRPTVLKALGGLKAEGATALYDALFLALQLRDDTADGRSIALVFSDGRDTASWLSEANVIEAARRSGVVVQVVELATSGQRPSRSGASRALERLADAGGGRRWSASSSRDLRELFVRVLEELRSRYLLTYYPTGVAREGWHDVKVTLKGARGDVIARPGYFVAAQ
ncbi:MAG: VWA domain-containing protein [Vicinamibacterales bacterium]